MSEPKERKTLEERNQASDLERLRHSCAHVLAAAICRIWPQAQLAAGPAIENGFYYDIELDHNISTAEFEQIEAEMKKIVKENQTFERTTVTRDEAMAMAQSGELGAGGPREVASKFKCLIACSAKIVSETQVAAFSLFWFIFITSNCFQP